MDCLIFDNTEYPVFQRSEKTNILPIEGVIGAIEINSGDNTSYEKLIADAEKLKKLGHLWNHRLPPPALALSHLPFDINPRTATIKQKTEGLTYHLGHSLKPQLLLFAEQLRGSLQEAATRLMNHNKLADLPFSVDGLFVLKKGFALHVDPNEEGWTAQRMKGGSFRFLSASDGHVLITLQNVILKNLYISGRIRFEGFDLYTAESGQGKDEISSATIVSDQEYLNQADQGIPVRA